MRPARTPLYRSVPVIIASLVCCAPVGVALMWLFAPWPRPVKGVISGVLGWWLIFGLIGMAVSGAPPRSAPTPTVVAVATVAPTAPPTAPPPAKPTVAPATPTAVPTPRPPTATPVPPTPRPAPPTATPRPARQAIAFSGRFDPRTLRVGQKLVVELTLENKSDRPIEGVRVFSRGPWDKYTVVNVVPNGRLESGMLGFNIYSGMTVPPGQTRVLSIVAYPNEPGNHEFSFIPNQDTTPLVDEKGEGIVIGGQVNVIR